MPNILRRFAWSALLCALVVAVGSQPAVARSKDRQHHKAQAASTKQKKQDVLCKQAEKLRKLVIKKVTKEKGKKKGKRAPGRNICEQGLQGGKKPSRGDKLDYKLTLHRIAHPAPVMVATTASQSGTPSTTPAPAPVATGGSLSAIAQCESGGNPAAISPTGEFRGKYQFNRPTWESVGGTGDPAAASEAEQDARAQMLYNQRGAQPWPVCGQ